MDRRTLIGALAGGLLAVPLLVHSQPATKTHRLGFLRIDRPPQAYIDAFEQGLRDRGYTPGKNILLEYRFGDGKSAELPRLAGELVSLKVDVIVAGGGQATQAAKNATNTIPIVMIAAGDPVGTGFIATLAHPGGNVTGTSVASWDLIGKRVELLRLILPEVSLVAVLSNSGNPGPPTAWKEASAAAATLGVNLQHIEVQGARDFDEAFAAMTRNRAEALIVVQDAMFDSAPYRIVQLAASNRLPAVYGPRITADAGGLMSYGPSVRDLYGQAAVFVDKILKGAKPGDLPIEQPTKFELIVNMKTAKALGLTIPQSLLLRADEVIQ
jgi:putative tryptophan/tyrosine transport system substrate-binding protein